MIAIVFNNIVYITQLLVYESVAQWQGIRFRSGGLWVRVPSLSLLLWKLLSFFIQLRSGLLLHNNSL